MLLCGLKSHKTSMDTPIWGHLFCRLVAMFIVLGTINYDIDLGFKRGPFPRTVHAELDASMRLKPSHQKRKEKVSLVVYRTNRQGNCLMMSKPCNNCIIKAHKIVNSKGYELKTIYYTNNDGNLVVL